MTRIAQLVPWLFTSMFVVSLIAETVQERGLPGAVQFEAVFPHIVSGAFGELRYETELIIVHSENRAAQLELELFFESGESAQQLLSDRGPLNPPGNSWSGGQQLSHSLDNGRFYFDVAAHSVRHLKFPGQHNPLVGTEFAAWAKLRSNVSVSAFQQIRVRDERGFQTTAEVTPSITDTKQAELSVMTYKCPWHSGDPVFDNAPQAGWVIGTYGISLVNSGDSPAEIEMELEARKKTLSLAPHSKQAWLLEEIADWFAPASCVKGGRLKARSINGVSFAILGIKLRMWVDLNLVPAPRADEPWLVFQSPDWTRLFSQERFNWPEEILTEAQLGARSIVLTRFGLIVNTGPADAAVHPVNIGAARSNDVGITVSEPLGLAVVYGGNEIPILFSASGRVLYVDEWGGGPATIRALADDPGKVEILTASSCWQVVTTVDIDKEEIVSVRYLYLPCPL